MNRYFVAIVVLLAMALPGSMAPLASATEATDVAAVPVVDALNRSEATLSNGGKWSALQWSTGSVKTGTDYGTNGWGPSSFDAFPKIAGAYWATSPGSGAVAAGVTQNVSPELAERYASIWLDMPNPGSAKSGYQLRWTLVSGLNTYSVKLLKWTSGSEKELASNASVSIPSGTRLMISDNGGTVTAWTGSGSTVSSLLTASDSTYSGGYAGIEASGNFGRSIDFRVGTFEPTVYWGAWMGGNVYPPEGTYGDAPWDSETWNKFESHAGKTVSLVHFGQPAPWNQAFASSPLKLARERGALPLLTMGSDGATLKEIASGAKDTSLIAWAQAARNYAYPFFFRWDWEINTTGYAWGKEAAESPTVYKEAWWHFHDVVEGQGATNVTWVWCPKAVSGGTSLSSLYPGKESEGKTKYVDWTCASVYNYGTNPAKPESWKSFSTIFSGTYTELLSLAPGKPVMVGELGSSEYGGSKTSWITDAIGTQLPSNFPQVKAVAWYNKLGGGTDWPIESSASAESAFAGSIAPSFYAGNSFSGPQQLTPISPLPAGSAPSMPTVSSVTPASPANNNSPVIKGSAPAGSAIHLYTNSSCTGTPVGNALAASFGTGITVSVADNTTTTFYANATNSWGASSCSSTSVTYTEDSAPPAKPSVTSFNPASPANNNAPKVIGSAEAGSTVKLYTNGTCTSAVAATGTAAAFASPGLGVSVADNTSTTFYATATDGAGNVSACSSGLTYVEDSIAPAAPTVSSTSPASGANNNSPKVIGSAAAETTVKIYSTASCTGSPLATGTAAAFASPGIAVGVADNTTTTFKATASDAAGNASACSSTSATYSEVTPKVYWGAWMGGNAYGEEFGDAPWDSGTWNKFEEHAGKKVSIAHFGQPAPWNQAFAEAPLKLSRERGALPLMDMDPDGVTLEEIISGAKDASFITWAKAVKSYGYPFFFRWAWEMNGTWFQWGSEAAKKPALYKEAWWHLHNLFEEQGATNITWVWCPNLSFSGSTSLSSLYPGDEYVDWTCLDGYNFGTNPAQPDSWKSFSTLYTTSYNELVSLAPSKPIMIGEMASTEYGGSKSGWITDAIGTQIPKNFPQIKAVVWFNKWEGGRDWPIESSAGATSAFASAIATNYYVGNEFGSPTKLTKINPLP
jgi:beta-mannanase